MICLFDVNTLLAIADESHIFHHLIHHLATTPSRHSVGNLSAHGKPNYRGGPFSPTQAIGTLRRMKADTAQKHVFWPDDFSITDDALIRSTRIAGPNQITDV